MNPFRVQPSLSGIVKTRILIGIGVPLLLLAGILVWYAVLREKGTTPSPTTNTTGTPANTNAAPEEQMPLLTPPDVNAQTNDADRDGLPDDEEVTLGTKKDVADTDDDGLSDRAEARTFGTNPLHADTDGDGTPDGEEVRRGNNPKGEGKLLDPATAINATS